MTIRFRDLPTKLTPKELDDRKHVASVAMRRNADLVRTMSQCVIESAYSEAHMGILRAATEDEVDLIERDFAKAALQLKGVLDAFDEA